ncbi:PKD domain-containing protein [Acidobacteriota bacterium]
MKVLQTFLMKKMNRERIWIIFLWVLVMGSTHLAYAGTISSTPSSPNVEQDVIFTLLPSGKPSSVNWDFGDGSTAVGGLAVNHKYSSPGTYRVRASYWGFPAQFFTDTATITVMENRRIEYSPSNPRINKPITFDAVNFLSSLVQWDFGDGTVISSGFRSAGAIHQTHTYTNSGVYTIRARDFGGASVVSITTTLTVSDEASISFQPAQPRVGEQVTFSAADFLSNTLIRWDFGDGVVQNDNTPPVITHTFNSQGTFRVNAYDGGGTVVTASLSIRIYPMATITFSSSDPRPGEPVSFVANNFFSKTLIRWDFGDGTIENDISPPEVSHSFSNPGVYTIRAYDGGSTAVTATTLMNVLPPRVISHSPQNPRREETVVFSAVNFVSASILWDFGDGTPPFYGGSQANHVYQNDGFYTVTANDFSSGISIPVTEQIGIVPQRGPRTSFSVSFIKLRFEDGKSYKVVPKNFMPLVSFAEIKFEGSGILVAQWMVDGSPFRFISQPLVQADQILIDSGNIPGLPTLIPGIHEVTLDIIQPAMEFNIPVIRYFVTSQTEAKGPVFNLSVSDVKTLDDEEIPFSQEFIKAPLEKHFLLKGAVRNESRSFIPDALIRIYLDDELIDQKILKDLETGEEREFVTSVFNLVDKEKKIYITVYDISTDKANLIYIKELIIFSEEK